jgi:hypothetical protein
VLCSSLTCLDWLKFKSPSSNVCGLNLAIKMFWFNQNFGIKIYFFQKFGKIEFVFNLCWNGKGTTLMILKVMKQEVASN